ncbi:hypothetical protein K402DRAFT_258551 [Aulographum hederae CBS 113979]|uniref:Extracellular membrane protein CFEM domain-containing protein n=1 Tax=Aulographum hederae CBS 113979 TaxID=1176131 RepID=A0A6G1H8R7_9PEZI|nr:hypothetical protein K402DRAFT_258551 [Aulographum hederae CBS 113979]
MFKPLIVVLVLALSAATVSAQSSSSSETDVAPTTSAPPTALDICLFACAAADVDCKADCVGVPHPDFIAANNTNNCILACPQGDGSAADNAAFTRCKQACISRFVIPYERTPGAPTPTKPKATSARSNGILATGSPDGGDAEDNAKHGDSETGFGQDGDSGSGGSSKATGKPSSGGSDVAALPSSSCAFVIFLAAAFAWVM